MDDADLAKLVQATAQGDMQAFKQLYQATSPLLFAIALRMLGRRDLAEEAVQDAYLTLWDKAGRFDPARGTATAFLVTVLRRRAIDRLRASPWLRREVPPLPEVEAQIDDLPSRLALRQCLKALDDTTRYSIVLAYLYGLTHAELHKITDIPLGTLKSRLRRGVLALKECLSL